MALNSKSNKKPKSETFLVASGDQALVAAGTDIVNPASFALNIADGQLAVVCASHDSTTRAFGETIGAADTPLTVPTIQIFQGTPNSANIRNVHPIDAVSDKAVVKSQKITPKNSLLFTGRVSAAPLLNAWVVGGTGGAITSVDSADYAMNVQFVSHRNDKYFGAHGEEDFTVNFSTPDYTALGTVSPLDHLVKNLVYTANLNSAALRFNNPASRRGNKNFIAFAVSEAGAGGTAINPGVSIVAGTPITVAVDAAGNNVQFTPDAAFVATMTELLANATNLTNASTIEVADLSTAGAAADADTIVLVAVDHQLAIARDDIPQVKVRLRVGLEYVSFDANPVLKEQVSVPFEGQGQGRKMKLWYESRAGLNIYTAQNRHWGPQEYITPPSYIDESVLYNAYIIEHRDSFLVPASHEVDWFHRTIILVPTADTTTIASLNTLFSPYLDAANAAGYVERAINATSGTWFA